MNRRTLVNITLAVIAVAILIAIYLANHSNTVSRSASQAPLLGTAVVGAPAPEFAVSTTHGLFDLAKAKKAVFLEVFATWCPHCQRETTVINALYAKYAGRVDFVAVSGSAVGGDGRSPESQDDVLNFADAFHVRYPIAYDAGLGVAKLYLQGGYPTIVVINAKKVVTYINSGEVSEAALAVQLRKAMR